MLPPCAELIRLFYKIAPKARSQNSELLRKLLEIEDLRDRSQLPQVRYVLHTGRLAGHPCYGQSKAGLVSVFFSFSSRLLYLVAFFARQVGFACR